MIDLAKIEKEIDELLANETAESLTEWIMAKRSPYLCAILESGEVHSLKPVSMEVSLDQYNVVAKTSKNKKDTVDQFTLAA